MTTNQDSSTGGRTADRTGAEPTDTQATTASAGKMTRRGAIAVGGALLALLLASIDQSVVGTALPRIVAELGDFQLYGWVGIAFMVAAVCVVPIAGKLGDMFGRKPFLVSGVVGFVAASWLCGLSQSMVQLIAFRAVQGLFGGVLLATIFTVLVDVCPPEQRVKMQGLATAVFGIGSVAGPTLGGVVTDTLGWRWAFYINVPLGLLSLIAIMTSVPRVKSTATWRSIDFLGVLTLVAAVVPLLIGTTLPAEGHAWSSPEVYLLLAIGTIMLAAFVVIELTVATNPVVPFRLFRIPQVSIIVALALLSTFGMMGTVYFAPLLYQNVLGVSATRSGNLLIPMMLALVVVSALSGKLLTRIEKYRFLSAGAFAAIVLAMVLLAQTGPDTGWFMPAASLVLVGAAMGVIYPMATSVVQHAVPMESVGAGTSQVQFWRMMGGPVALAALGAVLTAQVAGAVRDRLAAAQLPPGFQLPKGLSGAGTGSGLDAETVSQARAGVPAGQTGAFDNAVHAIRLGLADSMSTLFLVVAGVVAIAVVLSLVLKEVPLGKPQAPAAKPQEQPAGKR